MNPEEFIAEEFDPKDLPKFFSACVYGMRRSGKGVFVNDLIPRIAKKHHFTNCHLFSKTALYQEDDWLFIPDKNKHTEFKEEVLQEIMAKQKKEFLRWKADGKKGHAPSLLIIIDDLIQPMGGRKKGSSIFNSAIVTDMFVSGRHIGVSNICLLQSIASSVPPMARKNCDLIVYFRSTSAADQKTLCEDYITVGGHKLQEVKKMVLKNTEKPHTGLCLLLSSSQHAVDFGDYIFRSNAKVRKTCNFKIGEGYYTTEGIEDRFVSTIRRLPTSLVKGEIKKIE